MGEWRRYRLLWTPFAVRVCYPIALGFSGWLWFEAVVNHQLSWPVSAVFTCGFLGLIAWGERMVIKTGLYENEQGIVYRNAYGARLLPWDELERFDHRRLGTKDRVLAIMRNGHVLPLTGMLQGQRVIWDSGETQDVV